MIGSDDSLDHPVATGERWIREEKNCSSIPAVLGGKIDSFS